MSNAKSGATFKNVNHSQGGEPGGTIELMADLRPINFNLERIAAAIEKIQLVVNVPDISPQVDVHVAPSTCSVQVEAPEVKLTLPEMNPSIMLNAAEGQTIALPAPLVSVSLPIWPIFAAAALPAIASVVHILVSLGLLK